MIQELKIKNVLSFKNEVTFSFVASSDQFAEDSQVVKINDSTRLLRFGVLYGYNASGKSFPAFGVISPKVWMSQLGSFRSNLTLFRQMNRPTSN